MSEKEVFDAIIGCW